MTMSSERGIELCQSLTASTDPKPLPFVVTTIVGHLMCGRSDVTSISIRLRMMPTTVVEWAEPIKSVHHSVASGGASLPRRPPIVEAAQLRIPSSLISFCQPGICLPSDLRREVGELTTDSDLTRSGYFAAKRIATVPPNLAETR